MSDLIEVEDANGNRTRVTRAYLKRWPSVAAAFRPVAEKPTAPAVLTSPTGDKKKEN